MQRKDQWREDGNGGNAVMAFAVANGTKTNKYLSSTLINFIVTSVWFVIRGAFDSGMIAAARGANDIGMSTLILLGGVGTFAGFHLDWTEAFNVAFSVGATPVAADSVLAVWVLINPLLVEAADAWIKKSVLNTKRKRMGDDEEHVYRWPNGFASPAKDRVHLKGDDLHRFKTYMEQLGVQCGISNPVVELEQRPGQLVHVPAGWPHQVTNVSPNVKVAWDCYDACNMHKYMQLQSIVSQCFKDGMANDYMSSNMVICEQVGDL